MTVDDDYERFEYYISDAIERLRDDEGWSDSKIARFLRDEARSLDPPKPRRKVIDPLTISDEELAKFPVEVQEKVKKIRAEQLGKLKDMLKEIEKK